MKKYEAALYFNHPREGFPFCKDHGQIHLLNDYGSIVYHSKEKLCPYIVPPMIQWTNIALPTDGFKKHNLGPRRDILIQLCQGYQDPSTIIIGRLLTNPAEKTGVREIQMIIEQTLNTCKSKSIASRLDDLQYEPTNITKLIRMLITVR